MDTKDLTEMSLDEIIKKKKIPMNAKGTTRAPGLTTQRTGAIKKGLVTKNKVMDARNKIIQKNRSKIRDAREKLIQISKVSDARLRIMKKRKKPFPMIPMGEDLGRQPTRRPPRARSVSRFPAAPVRLPRNFEPMNMDNLRSELPGQFSLRRTVKNDIALPIPSSIPPFPNFSRAGRLSPTFFNSSDPFDCYEVPVRRPADVSEPMNIQRKIFNIDATDMPRKGILRTSQMLSPTIQRRFVPDENSSLSYEMRARLERAPDPNESSGIFSRTQPNQPPSSGYRIVVSNLHSSVSQGDIKELFEDIGELMEARLVRPGVAEVIFQTIQDAEEAVETYHNRHLDGQPMKCLLVHPRASSKPTAPALKPPPSQAAARPNSKSSSKTPLEIDIDALHKVLFRRN